MVDLSATQPDCERCGAPRCGLLHERSDLFLCRSCCADWDDDHPDDTSLSLDEACKVCADREQQIAKQVKRERDEELSWIARFLGPEKPLISN